MAKKQENNFNEYVLRIGTLVRTITLIPYDWGISVVVKDRRNNETKPYKKRKIQQTSSWFAELRSITRFMSASITSRRSIQMME